MKATNEQIYELVGELNEEGYAVSIRTEQSIAWYSACSDPRAEYSCGVWLRRDGHHDASASLHNMREEPTIMQLRALADEAKRDLVPIEEVAE